MLIATGDWSDDALAALFQATDCSTLVHLRDGQDIESLDADQMAELGWYQCDPIDPATAAALYDSLCGDDHHRQWHLLAPSLRRHLTDDMARFLAALGLPVRTQLPPDDGEFIQDVEDA